MMALRLLALVILACHNARKCLDHGEEARIGCAVLARCGRRS